MVDLARRAPQTWVMVGALALVHAASAAWIVRAGLGSPEADRKSVV